jgi:hypothetical protein
VSTCTQRAIVISENAPILGIDVGEDFLDVAMLDAHRATLSHHRVLVAGIRAPVVESLARRIADAVGCDARSGIALVDSPRTPRDIDCSGAKLSLRSDVPRTRAIDTSLRELLRMTFNGTMRPLAMFPTPLASYFAGCAADSQCKPHLRAIAAELFASVITMPRAGMTKSLAGGTFTRFMLAGFAAFPALERLGVRTFEAYPDLQMRLWSAGMALPPKKFRAEAFRVRKEICARLGKIVGATSNQPPRTLDEADAAVLALSAAASAATGSLLELHCPAEGRFAVAFEAAAVPPRA